MRVKLLSIAIALLMASIVWFVVASWDFIVMTTRISANMLKHHWIPFTFVIVFALLIIYIDPEVKKKI